jgi:hypothetical protein
MSVGTQPAAEPTELAKLSDKELIQRFCPECSDQAAGEELWRRYQQTIYEDLLESSLKLCASPVERSQERSRKRFREEVALGPDSYGWKDVAHEIYSDATKARACFLRRICGFRELDSPASFRAWLRRVSHSLVLDERRVILQTRVNPERRKKFVSIQSPPEDDEAAPREVTEESLLELPEVEPEPGPKVVEEIDVNRTGSVSFDEVAQSRSDYLYFHSRYSTSPLDPAAPVEWERLETERRLIFREVLTRHGQRSDENMMCANMIRLRHWRKWPVAKLVERFYGPPETERERQARHRACYRLLDKDYVEILAELGRAYGVVRPEQL